MQRIINYLKGRKLRGTDQYSNLYYEEATAHPTRTRRTVDFNGVYKVNPQYYDEQKLPPLWHSWLSHKRGEPPTLEECIADEERRLEASRLGREIEEKWERRKKELLDDPKYLLEKRKIEEEEERRK
jgi:NADH:ubiquinone oxidoreductase subunit